MRVENVRIVFSSGLKVLHRLLGGSMGKRDCSDLVTCHLMQNAAKNSCLCIDGRLMHRLPAHS